MGHDVVVADVLDWAASYAGEPFHAMLCDPPYELAFMGKSWDKSGVAFQPATWAALAAHLLPGAFLMAFGGSRTYHRLACAVEDAGLVVHPAIVWLNGSGFPKATRIDTAIDKAAGAEERRGFVPDGRFGGQTVAIGGNGKYQGVSKNRRGQEIPATPLAATWAGHRYGLQALKPAAEFILVAQKPYAGRPVDSITRTGAGALNIDGGRVAGDPVSGGNPNGHKNPCYMSADGDPRTERSPVHPAGRWPSNVVLQHLPPDAIACPERSEWGNGGCRRVGTRRVRGSNGIRGASTHIYGGGKGFTEATGEPVGYADADGCETVQAWECEDGCPIAALDGQAGPTSTTGNRSERSKAARVNGTQWLSDNHQSTEYPGDAGGPSRFFFQASWEYDVAERLATVAPFFYCAKSSRRERDAGLGEFEVREKSQAFTSEVCVDARPGRNEHTRPPITYRNPHPTVKPLALLIHLCRLLAPPPEYAPRRLLVPFAGSGSEICGAILSQGFEEIVGIEREEEYVRLAEARCRFWYTKMKETGSSDPGAILKACGKQGKAKQDSGERLPDESPVQMSLKV